MLEDMTIQRMDHVGELGLELEGEAAVDGRLELTTFHTPTAVSAEPNAPANALGIRRIMFAVEDIEDVLARLHAHGAELVGDLEQYEDSYRLCYVRGPESIIVALAEQLS
jgi:catechol 2,3-dioxygenase-like lactoylglutathione lyase family enzyme